jgi:putative addiction module component (TIGR02574 family)
MDPGRAMDDPSVRIESLSKDERLELIARLWERLSRTPSDVTVRPAQLAELDRRLRGS